MVVYEVLKDYGIGNRIGDLVIFYLKGLGYESSEIEGFLIGYGIVRVWQKIINVCGILEIPEELESVWVELSVAEILTRLKACGKLGDSFELGDNVKSVSMGDTSVTFDASFSEKSVQTFIDKLLEKGELEILCYRKLKW